MNDFLDYLMEIAAQKQLSANLNGEHSRTADDIQEQISVYEAGMAGKIPDVWKLYHADFVKLNDPEYNEYLRLKEKFEK